MLRVGHGYDVHKLVEHRKLILCGVEIPYHHGLLGHSDADVAVHALMDGILGALAIGDIGQLFPDNDPSYANIDSLKLLSAVLNHPKVRTWQIVNCDITIIAQAPKIMPYREDMRQNIAKVLGVDLDQVSVKATTTEELGFTGRKEGIEAHAVVLIENKNKEKKDDL